MGRFLSGNRYSTRTVEQFAMISLKNLNNIVNSLNQKIMPTFPGLNSNIQVEYIHTISKHYQF